MKAKAKGVIVKWRVEESSSAHPAAGKPPCVEVVKYRWNKNRPLSSFIRDWWQTGFSQFFLQISYSHLHISLGIWVTWDWRVNQYIVICCHLFEFPSGLRPKVATWESRVPTISCFILVTLYGTGITVRHGPSQCSPLSPLSVTVKKIWYQMPGLSQSLFSCDVTQGPIDDN